MRGRLDFDVVDNPAEGRYEARLPDGRPRAVRVIGTLRYVRRDGVVVMPSTVTDPEFRGNGVAGTLTRRALDDAREAGHRVQPDCWYVAEWIDAHPEYADLRSDRG